MVKYLSKFDHSLMTKCEPLNRLTQKDHVFQWAEGQQRAFEVIQKAIVNTPVLTYNELKKPVMIQTDMSDEGVGAVLLQNGKPVSYTSRIWKDYEKNYELCTNWKRDENCCVWITQVQRLLLQKTCNNRIRSQTIRSNQQQASEQSTKKTVKNDAFNKEFWLPNNVREGHWRNYYWCSFMSPSRGWQISFLFQWCESIRISCCK